MDDQNSLGQEALKQSIETHKFHIHYLTNTYKLNESKKKKNLNSIFFYHIKVGTHPLQLLECLLRLDNVTKYL